MTKRKTLEEEMLERVEADRLEGGGFLLLDEFAFMDRGTVIASVRVCDDGVVVGRTRYFAGLTHDDMGGILRAYEGGWEPPPWYQVGLFYDRRH
jgi:hypothetical protein